LDCPCEDEEVYRGRKAGEANPADPIDRD
jgi:hypothetical protein